MANIDEINEINTLLKSGSNEVAFEKMLKVLRNSPPADELATVSLMMMPFDLSSAFQAAELALQDDPNNNRGMNAYAEALARKGQFEEAERWFLKSMPNLKTSERIRWSEPTSCPTCGLDRGDIVDIRNLHRVHTQASLPDPIRVWVRCKNCKLVRVRDRLTSESVAMYNQNPGLPVNDPPDQKRGFYRAFMREEGWCERVKEVTGKVGRLLEVGPGWGVFMAAAEFNGFNVTGLEVYERSATWIRENLNLKVIMGQAPDDLPDDLFDVVASFEVIEHCQDPNLFLAGIAARVAPGGVLALSTPFIDHPVARSHGYENPMWNEVDHKVYYDRSTMAAALKRVGFSVVDQWSSDRHIGCVAVIAQREE